MTCRDLGNFSIPFNTTDILRSYSSAKKSASRRDIALAMASKDIDRSGDNQLNRLLAYRKERSIAPGFQEAEFERLAGDNYSEKQFRKEQSEAMQWQNNFLYNSALFFQSMLDKPSRFQQEDLEDLSQRLQDEGVALGDSFWQQGRSRSASRAPRTREPSVSGAGPAPNPSQIQVTNAFAQVQPGTASTFTQAENPSLAGATINIFNILPPVGVEAQPRLVKPRGRGRPPSTLDILSSSNIAIKQEPGEEPIAIKQEPGTELFGAGEEVKPRLVKVRGLKQKPVRVKPSDLGSSALPGADESAVEMAIRLEREAFVESKGAGQMFDPFSTINPEVVASAPENIMSFEQKARKMLELFDYPYSYWIDKKTSNPKEITVDEDLKLEYGVWLIQNPNNPRHGEGTFKKFLKSRKQRGVVQAGGAGPAIGYTGLYGN